LQNVIIHIRAFLIALAPFANSSTIGFRGRRPAAGVAGGWFDSPQN
jgi:hypothetical protein